jgi:hypothetical protein
MIVGGVGLVLLVACGYGLAEEEELSSLILLDFQRNLTNDIVLQIFHFKNTPKLLTYFHFRPSDIS